MLLFNINNLYLKKYSERRLKYICHDFDKIQGLVKYTKCKSSDLFYYVCKYNPDMKFIDFLLDNQKNEFYDQFTIQACITGSVDIVRYIISLDYKIYHYEILFTCLYEHFDILKILLEKHGKDFYDKKDIFSLLCVHDMVNMIKHLLDEVQVENTWFDLLQYTSNSLNTLLYLESKGEDI